jgi:protein phosphatase 2C family protein 2/3
LKINQTLLQSKQIVTSEPDVVESTVTEDWEFILLACDGIWDVMSNQQVCDFILKRLALNMQPENICEELMDRCVGIGTGTNFGSAKL